MCFQYRTMMLYCAVAHERQIELKVCEINSALNRADSFHRSSRNMSIVHLLP